MPPFARERIKKAHNGRETRGVLAPSTAHTVGASQRSIIRFFLSCLLFLAPAHACLLGFIVASHRSSVPIVISLVCHTLSDVHPAALVGSFYVYWSLFCVYFVYLTRPHALNVVKYQMFDTPWRYRRDHVSHMRLDRLRRACQYQPAGGASKTDSPKLIPVLIDIAKAGTISLAVTPTTTVWELREAICHQGYKSCLKQGPVYLMGLWRPLRATETMSDLGVHGICHFIMLPRLLGGSPGNFTGQPDGTVRNKHGWEQRALNPDGTSKDAADIEDRHVQNVERTRSSRTPFGPKLETNRMTISRKRSGRSSPVNRMQRGSKKKLCQMLKTPCIRAAMGRMTTRTLTQERPSHTRSSPIVFQRRQSQKAPHGAGTGTLGPKSRDVNDRRR
ncbi:hypothetical protein B0H10DRAFT_2135175, partial [Mycena sp. CBHHK59/15]